MTPDQLTASRSILFVPADRPERFAKALGSDADAVIIDLEDAVAQNSKAAARSGLDRWLTENGGAHVLVRVNSTGTPDHRADLDVCRAHRVAAVVLPKAESVANIASAHAWTGKPLWPIVESARGLANSKAIAEAFGVNRICLGTIDLALDMELDITSPSAAQFMDHARYDVAVASRVAGIATPVDGVHARLDDAEGLATAVRHAAGFGFSGMLAIHPRQTAVINTGFNPSAEDVAWAKAVLAEADRNPGAFSFRGMLVDAPILTRARRIRTRMR